MFDHNHDTIQLTNAADMRERLTRAIPVDPTELVDRFAGRKLTVPELYEGINRFCFDNGLLTVRFLRFFERSGRLVVMESMVVPQQLMILHILAISYFQEEEDRYG